MSTDVRPVAGQDELLACERLQEVLLGDRARSVLPLPTLAAIQRAGGLLLGAWEPIGSTPKLRGALVDLVAEADGYPARFTAFLGVHPKAVNRGIAQRLRSAERAACLDARVGLVFWWIDPLRSREAHIAFNKLGGLSVAHTRNALGPVEDRPNAGLASDRLRVEWWLDAPRVRAVLDEGRRPPHFDLGLSEMHVLTRTARGPSGDRRILGLDRAPSKPYVLVEIPVDLERISTANLEDARQWRLVTREAFEVLFDAGYVLVGLVHEGGRSFQLFERADRGEVLGRS
jgi:predicted GNAT superfamily acetyltransferase